MRDCSILCLLSILILIGCSQDQPQASIYEGCCGTQPSIDSRGQYSVYTPNVFTPNGDGKNDVFYPIINNDSITIYNFYIKTMTDTIIHFRQRLYYENIQHEGWSGFVFENMFYPELQRREFVGPFKYEYEVAYWDGTINIVQGTGCVVRCGKDAAVLKDKTDCFYSNQVSKGMFDNAVNAEETDCLK